MGDDTVQSEINGSHSSGSGAAMPVAPAETALSAGPVRRQAGRWYPSRHWRGEIALGYSFWGGTAVTVVIGGITGFVLALSSVQRAPRLYGALFLLTQAVSLAAGVWLFVGNWRSAGRRIADRHHENRRAFWAYLVRVVTVLDASLMVIRCLANPAVIPANLKILLGQQTFPPHVLRVLNDGKEIALTGGFDSGTAADLQAMLGRYPGVRTIDLSSTGGFVAEAESVRQAIQSHGLATYTDGLCASACTIAFIGGRSRYLGPHGRLGFHRYASAAFTAEQDGAANFAGQKSLLDAAIAPEFAAKAFSTPNTSIWYPDATTLLRANVVTQIVNGLPAFGALKEADLTIYEDAYQSIVDGAQNGKSVQQTWGRAESLLRSAEAKYQARAGDAIERQLAALMADEGDFLASANPTACLMLFRTIARVGPDYAAFLSAELDTRDKAAAAGIIQSGSRSPVTALDGADALTTIASAWMRVRQQGYDMAALGRPPRSAEERRYLCKALSAFMLNVAQHPPAQAGPVMRQLAGASLGPAVPGP